MKLSEMQFKVTDKTTGESYVFGWEDIFGYEGESWLCGVYARNGWKDIRLTYNTGDDFSGVNENLDIDVVKG